MPVTDGDLEFRAATETVDLQRVDLADKIFGRPRFIHDLVFDGMLHARIVRPPNPGAHFLNAPIDEALTLPGVRKIIAEGDFVAIIAEREGQAERAATFLATKAKWSGVTTLPEQAELSSWIRAQPTKTTKVRQENANHLHGEGHTTLKATYTKPFVAHGSIAPSCGIAIFDGHRLEVWSSSQGVFRLRTAMARALNLEVVNVVVQHVEGAGSYGHNGADDAAFEAALLAMRLPGKHIRIQWSRADELIWEPFGPAMVSDVEATLDQDGMITDWSSQVWSNGHAGRPGYTIANGFLSEAHLNGVSELPASADLPASASYGAARNAEPGYEIDRIDVTAHHLLSMPIRSSALRSLGAHHNIFAIESFMDELANTAGRDPLTFRLAQLSDPRARAVLTAVAEAADWGQAMPANIGRGIAYARYKNRGAYCAVIADVEAEERVKIKRLTIAVDVGRVISADGVRNQIEGGAIQSSSWTLHEQVRFDRERITSSDWETYPILHFSEVPRVDVHLIGGPDEASLGAGEATQGPVPAAIGNALFDLLGLRLRHLPFTQENIVAAIEGQ
ncbi:nicotinate dehydrogenase subunit B [mine drainage metagenome]|uniref:Nicotinate dehydrogenase subunit B n=1 Tax=mine drainage metagenome TaxID=410659 RepID=A0A1J5QG32_9ZZZZ